MECLICYEIKNLICSPCNHNICEDCYNSWKESCNNQKIDFTCVYCRNVIEKYTFEEKEIMGLFSRMMSDRMAEQLIRFIIAYERL